MDGKIGTLSSGQVIQTSVRRDRHPWDGNRECLHSSIGNFTHVLKREPWYRDKKSRFSIFLLFTASGCRFARPYHSMYTIIVGFALCRKSKRK